MIEFVNNVVTLDVKALVFNKSIIKIPNKIKKILMIKAKRLLKITKD